MFPLTTNPRMIAETDFPATGTPAHQWCFLINYALLAPSEYNIQPWLFRVQGDSVELCADSSRRLPVVDPQDRELIVSCGAACLNLRLAARHFGIRSTLEYGESVASEEKPGLQARLRCSGKQPATPEDERLFAAITHRQSNRSVYQARSVPEEVLAHLQSLAGYEGTWLRVIEDAPTRKTIADLIVAGDRQQWANKDFRRELAKWVHPRAAENTDGLPASVHAKGSFHDMTSPFLVRTFDLWREETVRNRHLAAGAPVLMVLGTFTDTSEDWFAAGMAVERVLLGACANSLQTSFVNQPIEVPSLRSRLCQALARKDFPQLIIRMGYGEQAPWTPRRSVQDVLLEVKP